MSVGYEYESCLDVVLWEKRTAVIQGYELDASNMGGWMLDKHHILDLQNGKKCSLPAVHVCFCVCGAEIGASAGYWQVVFTLNHRSKGLNQNEIWFVIPSGDNRGEF